MQEWCAKRYTNMKFKDKSDGKYTKPRPTSLLFCKEMQGWMMDCHVISRLFDDP